MSVVFVRNGKRTDCGECLRGLNILGHAQLIEYDLGSECGGHGVCGKDRIRLRPEDWIKVNPPTEDEREHLTQEQINAGWRLGCQCFPAEDGLDLEVSHGA